MLSFENDYSEGAHERILNRLSETNRIQVTGYGMDPFCDEAKSKIRRAIQNESADIYFISGGTQTNQLVIDSMLTSYEGVISAETGHVNVHEAGAIEYSGHKVLTLPAHDGGKLDPAEVKEYLRTFFGDANNEHMVFPGMVYISHPTEYGALYTRAELKALHDACAEYDIPLYMDGARLGYALASRNTDVALPDVAELTDVFYIGGTKVGALCGEAVVFTKNNTPKHFVTLIKQHGALLAKGRVLGVQFAELFTDDLYLELGKNAIDAAEKLKKVLHEKGYRFYFESPTNQQFLIMDNETIQRLREKVVFSYMEKYNDSHTVVRFCTSWATPESNIDELAEML